MISGNQFIISSEIGEKINKMAKAKKRLSKNAKEALKILNDSKLLATAKTINDSNTAQNFKPTDSPAKTSAANKMRPSKKRG